MNIFRKLPVLNLTRRPVRTAVMLFLVALLSFSVFGGALMISGLKSGMNSLEDRLGADLMIVPEEAAGKSGLEGIILEGNSTYFYMEDTKLAEVRAVDGVGEITSQLFLASLAASCCSAKVQLMGFDPETDFSILPWIRKNYGGRLDKMDIVVGADIVSDEGDRLLFYDTPCTVVAKLSPTGTNYDRCVFAGEDTVRELTQSSVGKKLNQFKDVDPNHVISCILLNVREGYDIDEVAQAITTDVEGVTAVRTGNLISGISDSLAGMSRIVGTLILVICLLAFTALGIAFTMQINERRKEFGVLRVLGVSGKLLARCIWREILLLCVSGGLLGALLAGLVVPAFSGALQSGLEMPLLRPGISTILQYLALSVATAAAAGTIASFWNVRRMARTDISLALRQEK